MSMQDANVICPAGSTFEACEGPATSAPVSVSSSSSSSCAAYKSRKWFLRWLPHVFCHLCSAFVGAASACWGDCDLRRFCEMSDNPASVPLSSSFHHVRSMTPISKRCRSLLELCPFVFRFFFKVKEVEEDHMRWSSSCATRSTSVTRR